MPVVEDIEEPQQAADTFDPVKLGARPEGGFDPKALGAVPETSSGIPKLSLPPGVVVPEGPDPMARTPLQDVGMIMGRTGAAIPGALADVGTLDPSFPNLRAAVMGRKQPIQATMENIKAPLISVPYKVSSGLLETAPKLAAVAGLQAAGVPAPAGAAAVFGTTEEGFDPKQAAIAAALPFVGRYSGEIVGALAKKLGVSGSTALELFKGAGSITGAAGYLATIDESEIQNLPPEERKQARIDAVAGLIGQSLLGPMGLEKPKGPPGGSGGPPARPQAELPPSLAEAGKALPRTAEAANQAIAEEPALPEVQRHELEGGAKVSIQNIMDKHGVNRDEAVQMRLKALERFGLIKDVPEQPKEPNAIQEQKPDAGVLRPKEPEVGLPPVGEGNAEPQKAAGKEETGAAGAGPAPREVGIDRAQRLQDLKAKADKTPAEVQEMDALQKASDSLKGSAGWGGFTKPEPLNDLQATRVKNANSATSSDGTLETLLANPDPKLAGTTAPRAMVNELRNATDKSAVLDKWEAALKAGQKAVSDASDSAETDPVKKLDAIQRATTLQHIPNEGLSIIADHGERLGFDKETVANAKKIIEDHLQRAAERRKAEPGMTPKPDVPAPPVVDQPVNKPVTFDPASVATVETPVADIKLSKDVPNFKAGADPETGIVPGQELKGPYQRLGSAPIIVWRRLNGDLEVITGRHRLDLARRTGEKTIPTQIVDEAKGYTKAMALTEDAEGNIRDNQGTVEDYAHYFKNRTDITEEAARQRGLLRNAAGRSGFDIGRKGSDDLQSLWKAGKLTESQAGAIARAAPGNAEAQAIGSRAVLGGKPADMAVGMMQAAQLETGGSARALDLFGKDDAAMQAMEDMAKRAVAKQRQLREDLAAIRGAAKNPEAAAKYGLKANDPSGLEAKVADLKAQLERWQNWPLHQDLVAEVRGEAPKVAPEAPKLRAGEKGTGELLQGEDQPFNLAGETGTDADRIAAQKAQAEKDAAEAKAKQDKEQGGLPGMPAGPGAATRPDIVPGGPDLPVEPGNPDTFGIAERVRKQREAAGQTASTEPGEGISAPDSVEHGRDLLASGKDPEAALAQFEKTKRLSADDMALVRAHGEALAKAARNIEGKFGTNSPEYKVAWDALSAWDKRSKAMQTEWHKTGQAQQGETDIDTGTFTGLQRAFTEATGKEFNPAQAAKAKETAARVKASEDAAAAAKKKLFEQADKERLAPEPIDPKIKSIADRIVELLDKSAAKALERIKARRAEGRMFTGIDPMELRDYVVYGASKLARGVLKSEWIKAMVNDIGDFVKPHLDDIFKKSEAMAQKLAEDAVGKQGAQKVRQAMKTPAETTPREKVWTKVKEYVEAGRDDFDEIRNKIATDLGMKVDEVTKLITESKPAKRLADDVWKKQQIARRVKEQAKRWLNSQTIPGYQRALSNIPKILFSLKVGFHGTVALGTHAPMVAFQPRFWANYVRDFGKMYKMVGSPAYYERQVQDLLRRPNYITARRAGLVNDPFSYEDYNSPDVAKYFGRLSGMGNRGYAVLKILRQDMFDQMWNKLPETSKVPEVAEGIANGLNHATGVVKGMAPKGANIALFAPRLAASRVAWLAVDPIKAADTFLRWNKSTDAEKNFAVNQVKEKAWVLGTAAALLAINQGVLTATGSKQKVNLTDPMKSDFMKFKVGGMTFSYGNAMLTMARLPVRLLQIRQSSGGKLKNVVYPDEDVYSVLGEYTRSQLSPFASLVATLWFKSDWMRRNLPNSNRPMPARLRKQGVKPYTWTEFLSEVVLPIPAEEAAREVWKNGLGMSEEQVRNMRKALATIIIMGATGARLSDDTDIKK